MVVQAMLKLEDIATLARVSGEASFRDARNSVRLARITARAAADPSLSFPEMFTEARELEAAYRFFANAAVSPESILSSHFEATRRATEDKATVLVIHDSSTFAFDPDGSREGLGRIKKSGQAFFGHFSLALDDDGSRRPHGVVGLKTWVRSKEPSVGEKQRWLDGVERASKRLGGHERAIHVMDREADDFELFAKLVAREHRFVIRVKVDRVLPKIWKSDPRTLTEAAARIERSFEREARISKRLDGGRSPKQKSAHPSRAARTVKLAIGAMPIVLQVSKRSGPPIANRLAMNLVRVWEVDPQNGDAPIEWLLLTSEEIQTPESIVRIVDRYRARWTIEEYFKVLKTGCAFKKRQLHDYEGLINALAVFAPIACRLLWLRTQAHKNPDTPAGRVLDADELHVLRVVSRRPLPENPTTRDVLLSVAALGGHIKWSGDPGWLTLARGFTRLATLTEGYSLARIQPGCDQR